MRSRLAFLSALLLAVSSSSTFAQNVNELLRIFGGVMQQAMIQGAQSEWRKLPPNDIACIDQGLREQGANVEALIHAGVMPSDPRLSRLRADCHSRFAQGPQSVSSQASLYVVDGLALGGQVRFESEVYKRYECKPSEQFRGFTWCHKEGTEKTNRGEVMFANSILHSQDGTALYVNRYIEPAFFGRNDVRSEIDRLSAKFGERAREFRIPRREGLPNAVIAVWGDLELEQLSAVDASTVASGGSLHKGFLVSFLGDLQRSAKAGMPLYRIAGGAGYLWAATYNQDGRGVLRFLTIDASQIGLPTQVATNTAPPPATNAQPPAPAPTPLPPPATVPPKPTPVETPALAKAREFLGDTQRFVSRSGID